MVAWKGHEDDKRIYLTTSALGDDWTGQVQLADRGTAVGPSPASGQAGRCVQDRDLL